MAAAGSRNRRQLPDPAQRFQPRGAGGGPVGDVGHVSGQSEAVLAGRVDVHREGDAVAAQGSGVVEAVEHADRSIVGGRPQEGRWNAVMDRILQGQLAHQLGIGRTAEQVVAAAGVAPRLKAEDRIAQDGSVGSAAVALDRIGMVGTTGLAEAADAGGTVAAGREAEHSDTLGVDAPSVGVGADQADGTLGVVQGRRVAVRPHAVAADHGGEAERTQPLGHRLGLVIGMAGIAAAGQDDDGRALLARAAGDHGRQGRHGVEQSRVGAGWVEAGRRSAGWP